jgi:predicted DNA-binding transcriptional regulator AlpA
MSPEIIPIRPTPPEPTTPEVRPEVADNARLIDRDELASRLSIGTSTLDRLRAAGKIGPRVVRVGGAVRFMLPEVIAWVSHLTPGGELHTIETWPAVWASMQKKTGPTSR